MTNNQMNVIVVGGYGEFGGRVVRLLLRDSHSVIVAGRDLQKAQKFCKRYGGTPLQFDRQIDADRLSSLSVDVVVDAAGPFQSYGSDPEPYRLAEAAISASAHYLDLSDDGEFARGIEVLNERAIAASCVVLSGVSSTPALSSAVVAQLSQGMSRIALLSIAILPGARAPRGESVMQAILGQIGNSLQFWRDNQWRSVIGWSGARKFRLADDTVRSASFIGTADTLLFAELFKAESVVFRAGLEPPVEQHSLSVLSWLRRTGLLPDLRVLLKPLSFFAKLLEGFGRDRGAMVVEVTGEENQIMLRRRWQLCAKEGVGPFVAATPVAVMVNHLDTLRTGARVCLCELSLMQFENTLHKLDIVTSVDESPAVSLFQSILGDSFNDLPESLRESHRVYDLRVLSGVATITRGQSLLCRFIAAVFRFPGAGEGVPVTVTKSVTDHGETWIRDFKGQQFRSYLSKVGSNGEAQRVFEKFGLLKFELSLPVQARALHWYVKRGWFLGVPMPGFMLPVSNTREYEKEGKMHFDVELRAPMGLGLLVNYKGWLVPTIVPGESQTKS